MQAALRLKSAQDSADGEQMRAAARLNWRLWTIIQAELLDPECTVPADIRGNVLSLARFIDQHTVAFISDPQPEKLNVLISIDRELSAGLYQVPPASGPVSAGVVAPAAGSGAALNVRIQT
jgi:flagellar protein FlaF